jgi:cold shock CspA family protein
MRFEGELVAWNEQSGYGAIRPLNGGEDVIVGQGAFPTDGDIPQIGELLSFEIVTGRDGRKKATKLSRMPPTKPDTSFGTLSSSRGAQRYRASRRRRRLAWSLVALGLAVGVVSAWQWSVMHRDAGPGVPATGRR